MTNKHKTRTIKLQPNLNKTFSVGIPIVVENYYQNLGFEDIFGPPKSKGVDINSLVKLLATYKLVENHSIVKAADWANQTFVRERYGREGFFCLKLSKNLTLAEALVTYRKKDSIEKIFHSLKNEIEIKPVRCWKKERHIGVLLIGFIAQLFISLLRYDVKEICCVSTKFIKKSLRNLTETNVFGRNGVKMHIFSNFDDMNMMILRKCGAIS